LSKQEGLIASGDTLLRLLGINVQKL